MKIHFLRHCSTSSNILNTWQGISNNDISEKGLEEIEYLKKISKNIKFDIIYSSPLKRAIKTANIFKNSNNSIVIDNLIIERNFGQLEGSFINQKDKEELSDLFLNTDLNKGVEKINEMYQKRIKPFLLSLKEKHQNDVDKNILIVSHSWVGRLISFFSTKESNPNIIKKAPKNGEIIVFEI